MANLGVNNQRALDLAALLRTQIVHASCIRKGDVIISDYQIWVVASVAAQNKGTVSISDSDDNGIVYPIKANIKIIHRDCFK